MVLVPLSALVLTAMFKTDDDVEGLGETNPLAQAWLFGWAPTTAGVP